MFAKKLKALREDRGWTKAELSRRSGIPTRTLSAYESGDIEDPSWSHVCALCRAFKVSCEHFNSESQK